MKINRTMIDVIEMERDMRDTLDSSGLGERGLDSAGELQHETMRRYTNKDELLGFGESMLTTDEVAS